MAFAERLPSSQHCPWDWEKQELFFSPGPFTAQDAGEAEQHDAGLVLLPTQHSLIALDRGERDDSGALNRMLQLLPHFPSKVVKSTGGIN